MDGRLNKMLGMAMVKSCWDYIAVGLSCYFLVKWRVLRGASINNLELAISDGATINSFMGSLLMDP